MNLRTFFQLFRKKKTRIPDIDQSSALESPPPDRIDETPSLENEHRPILELNLGIDFGTRFTKVCFRNSGTEQSEVVNFGGDAIEDGMIASIVTICSDGALYLCGEYDEKDCIDYKYLKMKLAGFSSIGDEHLRWQGVSLDDDEAVRALSSWFLAKVILKAKEWIKINRKDLLHERDVRWSANVGVPVEHYDSDNIKVFEEVFPVGWSWAERGDLPSDFRTAKERYESDTCTIVTEITDCHAIPELSAALQSFVISREAQEGVYMYFDIGGGTVDGVSFNYYARHGEKSVNFYSGKLDELGVSAVVSSFGEEADKVEQILSLETASDLGVKLNVLELNPRSSRRKKTRCTTNCWSCDL
ncbi:MAG: hypothetical protein OXI60_02295 [Acidiferrobacterales bacterium]|nr:hypothetical protein [Acidiferrobacterales bacterium]